MLNLLAPHIRYLVGHGLQNHGLYLTLKRLIGAQSIKALFTHSLAFVFLDVLGLSQEEYNGHKQKNTGILDSHLAWQSKVKQTNVQDGTILVIREFKKNTTATATGTSLNKGFNE